jgi:hypothetical protein
MGSSVAVTRTSRYLTSSSPTARLIQFALLAAGREDEPSDQELGPIHLIKYVYLADLAHAERNQARAVYSRRW